MHMASPQHKHCQAQRCSALLGSKVSKRCRTTVQLNQGWHFRQADDPDGVYRETQGFPTEIHLDLLHNGLIPDPFIGKHENDVQWVGEKPWTYRTSFRLANGSLHDASQTATMIFEGLDTYATVVLNGKTILKCDNMFLPSRVEVTDSLLCTEVNVLEITFDSAYLIGKQIVEKNPHHKWGCWNGDPSRLAVRKAQYHYGWDWGPALLTCGPWKPISLEIYETRISDLSFRTNVSESLDAATVVAKLDFEGQADHVKFEMSVDSNCVASCVQSLNPSHTAEATMRTMKPRLWYPRRYGEQPLYTLTASLLADIKGRTVTLDSKSKRFGLRRAEVMQRKLTDSPGTTFMFKINNIDVFCGGSNWIPAHSFQSLLKPEGCFEWVKLAADGNQVMLRVWGGGIYEQDAFYEACDEMGVLVWQDFLFACGNYPAADIAFVDSIEKEAIANVKRLRHHPCIVIWAGNNEDYQYRETEDLDYDPQDQNPSNWLQGTFPARYIYERVLKNVAAKFLPGVFYHFGSPYGGSNTTDPTVGDIHQWNVWHGSQEKYQDFDKLSGRFVSEFGMEAYPDIKTIDGFLVDGKQDVDRYPQSSTVEFHNKAAGHERRLALYLAENIRYTLEPFEQYIYCTQLVQAEAVGTAYRLWKRQWKGPGREYCAGVLVWQMNDCWPAISWSIVDHFRRPKLAYFAVKREMESFTVGMKRTIRTIAADKYTRAYIRIVHELEIWACNLTQESKTIDVNLKLAVFRIAGSVQKPDKDSKHQHSTSESGLLNFSIATSLLPNRSTEIGKYIIPSSPDDADQATQTIIQATISDHSDHKILAHAINWPEPLKHVHLAHPSQLQLKLSMGPENDDDNDDDNHQTASVRHLRPSSQPPDWWRTPHNICILSLTSDVPLKGVKIEVENDSDDDDDDEHVVFEDQGFDITDDQTVWLRVWGLQPGEEGRLRIRYLGM